jgi:hypothetical protein
VDTFGLKNQASVCWLIVNPKGRLYSDKYITQGHKHLAPGKKSFEKKRAPIQTILSELNGNLWIKKLNECLMVQRKIVFGQIYHSRA